MGDASNGVILFSLGSTQHTSKIPAEYLHVLIEAFKRIPQKVLMKFHNTSVENDNIKTTEWLPQQDVLGMKIMINILYNRNFIWIIFI